MISISLWALAVVDQFTHKIPNSLLMVIFFESLILSQASFNPIASLVCIFGTPILWRMGIGGGDIKLLAFLLIFLKPGFFTCEFLGNLLLATLCLSLISLMHVRTLRARIPFAPAIVAAYLLSL